MAEPSRLGFCYAVTGAILLVAQQSHHGRRRVCTLLHNETGRGCSAGRAEEWGREAGRGDSDGDELEDKGVAEVEERAEAPVGRARLEVELAVEAEQRRAKRMVMCALLVALSRMA